MRISVNLATKPFVELRPLLAKLRLAMLGLTLLAIGLVFALNSLDQKAKVATAQMDRLKAQTSALEDERARNEARMMQPQNRGVLERAEFLNNLFARKSFSWTAVMMDLERVLPVGVQVTSIEPVISKTGDVSIRLRVSGERAQAIQLVRNLEHTQRFIAPRLAGESALAADKAKAIGVPVSLQTVSAGGPVGSSVVGPNLVEFEIFSDYNPLPPAPPLPKAIGAAPARSKRVKPSADDGAAHATAGGAR